MIAFPWGTPPEKASIANVYSSIKPPQHFSILEDMELS